MRQGNKFKNLTFLQASTDLLYYANFIKAIQMYANEYLLIHSSQIYLLKVIWIYLYQMSIW